MFYSSILYSKFQSKRDVSYDIKMIIIGRGKKISNNNIKSSSLIDHLLQMVSDLPHLQLFRL